MSAWDTKQTYGPKEESGSIAAQPKFEDPKLLAHGCEMSFGNYAQTKIGYRYYSLKMTRHTGASLPGTRVYKNATL